LGATWVGYGAVLIAGMNVVAFGAMWLDKQRAQRGQWRISEGTLLLFAMLGGWFGAKSAQRRFRNKTQKQPFAGQLNLIPVFWLIGAVFLISEDARAIVANIFAQIAGPDH